MSVWLTIPSARPLAEVRAIVEKWKAQGYKVALWRDKWPFCGGEDLPLAVTQEIGANVVFFGEYPGYALAVNQLIRMVVDRDPAAEWFVIGGDDVEPDTTKLADEIAFECKVHFAGYDRGFLSPIKSETFGVMQPTGDRWGESERHYGKPGSAYIDRVAGSAWIGKQFALRTYAGKGPLYWEYGHMFVDEELQRVAEKLDAFWQRRDLTHHHKHWARENYRGQRSTPAHLEKWTSAEHWKASKALFDSRAEAGFPGYGDLA